MATAWGHWLWKFYRRSYAIHQKPPKVCRPAYRKGYRSVGKFLGPVVEEDHLDYQCHPASVWIKWRRKIKQSKNSRDKSLKNLLLTSWQTFKFKFSGEERSSKLEASHWHWQAFCKAVAALLYAALSLVVGVTLGSVAFFFAPSSKNAGPEPPSQVGLQVGKWD